MANCKEVTILTKREEKFYDSVSYTTAEIDWTFSFWFHESILKIQYIVKHQRKLQSSLFLISTNTNPRIFQFLTRQRHDTIRRRSRKLQIQRAINTSERTRPSLIYFLFKRTSFTSSAARRLIAIYLSAIIDVSSSLRVTLDSFVRGSSGKTASSSSACDILRRRRDDESFKHLSNISQASLKHRLISKPYKSIKQRSERVGS